jgi:hypothetical protein
MDHPLAVRLVERVGDLDGIRQCLVEGQAASVEPRGQRLALHVLHDQIVQAVLLADVVERARYGGGSGC